MAQDFERFEQGRLLHAVLPGGLFYNRLEQSTLLAARLREADFGSIDSGISQRVIQNQIRSRTKASGPLHPSGIIDRSAAIDRGHNVDSRGSENLQRSTLAEIAKRLWRKAPFFMGRKNGKNPELGTPNRLCYSRSTVKRLIEYPSAPPMKTSDKK